MIADVVGPAVFWVAAALKLRRVAEPSQRPIAAAFVCLAAGLTMDIEPVARALDRAVGINNLSILFKHCVAVVGVFFLLMFMRQVAGQLVRSRFALTALFAVLLLLATTFVLAGQLPETMDFADRYGDQVMVRAYWLVTIAYFAVCLWSLMRLSVGTARRATRREVRIGFGMVGAGVLVGLTYSLIKIVELLYARSSFAGPAGHLLLIVGALSIGGGLLYPVAVGSLASARLNTRCRVLLLRLRPAWSEAITRRPGVVLGRPPGRAADAFGRKPRARLYRRVIEIEDIALDDRTLMTGALRSMLDTASALAVPRRWTSQLSPTRVESSFSNSSQNWTQPIN